MTKGLLIYAREDYHKNTWFAQQFLDQAGLFKMTIDLVLTDELSLELGPKGPSARAKGEKLENIDFVINRSRDSLIGRHFELMGARVFNHSKVSEICNNKAKTHQLMASHGIGSVKTLLCNKRRFSPKNMDLGFPCVLKSVRGHGGDEVFMILNKEDLQKRLLEIQEDDFILQALCQDPGKDIRVFVLGEEILGAVMRYSQGDFRSNISQGGGSRPYTLKEEDKKMIKKIIKILPFDLVGIDFIFGEKGQLLFNEIEDVVGTRTLYKNYPIDIVEKYLKYIKG